MFNLSTFQTKDTIRDYSIEETFKFISTSNQTLIKELISVCSGKDELEYQDVSTLTTFLPLSINQDSKSKGTVIFRSE